MIGPSADDRCACGRRMPLPESHGKHCPDCGTKVPTWEEMRTGTAPPNMPRNVSG